VTSLHRGESGDAFDLFADDPHFNAPAAPQELTATSAISSMMPRFVGDTGLLPERACYAYQELLKREYVDRSSKNWAALLDHRDSLASRLSELNMLFVIDEERGFAYKSEAEVEGGYSLLAKKPIRWMDSILLVYLRLQQALEVGRYDDTIVERRDIVEHLRSYRRPADTDHYRHDRQIDKSIETMVNYGILIPLTGTDRFLVAPVLSAAFPLAHVEALNDLYLRQAGAEGVDDMSGTDQDGSDETHVNRGAVEHSRAGAS
jgi:Domain of unknown function (DUF4194)